MRARQLQRKDKNLEKAVAFLQRMRTEGKERFDETHNIRLEEFEVEDFILLFNERLAMNMSKDVKLKFKWQGPYRIHMANPVKDTYCLKELDRTILTGIFPKRRLKKFNIRDKYTVFNSQRTTANAKRGEDGVLTVEKNEQRRSIRIKKLMIPEGQTFAVVL